MTNSRFVPVVEPQSNTKIALDNEILRVVNGSQLYGTSNENSDVDEIGVFIEPLERFAGLQGSIDSAHWRSKPEGQRSSSSDRDIALYGFRHFVHLCCKGNPSALLPLFADSEFITYEDEFGKQLRAVRHSFLGKDRIYNAFRGYATSQKMRLLGERHGHTPSRPELIESFGYDTKYVMHILRLLMQGRDLLRDGTISLPMPPGQVEYLLSVRGGQYPLDFILDDIELLFAQLDQAYEDSEIPAQVDMEAVSDWLSSMYMRKWRKDQEI